MLRGSSQYIGGAQDLVECKPCLRSEEVDGRWMSYVGHVVVEVEIVVDDGMVGMIELQKMLESSSPLVRVCLYIVCFDWREGDGVSLGWAEYSRDEEWIWY